MATTIHPTCYPPNVCCIRELYCISMYDVCCSTGTKQNCRAYLLIRNNKNKNNIFSHRLFFSPSSLILHSSNNATVTTLSSAESAAGLSVALSHAFTIQVHFPERLFEKPRLFIQSSDRRAWRLFLLENRGFFRFLFQNAYWLRKIWILLKLRSRNYLTTAESVSSHCPLHYHLVIFAMLLHFYVHPHHVHHSS